jgi:hypothetical protein
MDPTNTRKDLDFLAYHRSLAAELNAVKDRVRHLIRHWPTDGSFKESVLRSVLRRHLPESLFIGTGFVVTAADCSRQIDLLIVDKDRPRLFWDGDLIIVTPDAVRAAIEVKTGLDGPTEIDDAIITLAANKITWVKALYGWNNWTGLFVFEARGDHGETILRSVAKARKLHNIKCNCIAYGPDLIVEYRVKAQQPGIQGFTARNVEGLAAACFLTNLISYFSKESACSNPLAWQLPVQQSMPIMCLSDDGDGEIKVLNQAN